MTQDLTPEAVAQALAELRDLVRCRCHPAYKDRGRHDPACDCDSADAVEIIAAKLEEVEVELDYTHGTNDLLRGITEAAEALASKLAEVERERDEAREGWHVMHPNAVPTFTAAEAEVARLREALTPSSDTKAAYSGEFRISVYDAEDSQGNEIWRDVLVDWTTIKAIMATIMSRAALQPKETDHG
jgi:hypothetical protein